MKIGFSHSHNIECATTQADVLYEIIPQLFIGDHRSARDNSFKAVVNCAAKTCQNYSDEPEYLNLYLEDEVNFSIIDVLDCSADFIHEALKNEKKVLVHCEYGRSRSAAILIGYLIKYHNHSYQSALNLIQRTYLNALPNYGFKKQLIDFYQKCRLRDCAIREEFKYYGENSKWIPWKEYRYISSNEGNEICYVNGKWGMGGANVILMGKIQGIWKIMLFERSKCVDNPHTWCFPGGARKIEKDSLEEPLNTAIQELREEAGCLPRGNLLKSPIVVSEGDTIKHYFYILQVEAPEVYTPKLNWESTQFKWHSVDEIEKLKPHLHVSVDSVFNELVNTFNL